LPEAAETQPHRYRIVIPAKSSRDKIACLPWEGNHVYADIGLLTCDPAIASDTIRLFHYLTGHSRTPDCSTLLTAPVTMRPRLIDLIRREASNHRGGLPARIVAKMNQLEDPALIEAFCEAASAGVPVDLIVRGFCCLRPGRPGRSEGIRVRSVIGRFLEHSRIFHFAAGAAEPEQGDFFIGSADWMYRNLSKRVEVIAPILSVQRRRNSGRFSIPVCKTVGKPGCSARTVPTPNYIQMPKVKDRARWELTRT
jgi:polyphosphate kinase